jgi:hypothetical protein
MMLESLPRPPNRRSAAMAMMTQWMGLRPPMSGSLL